MSNVFFDTYFFLILSPLIYLLGVEGYRNMLAEKRKRLLLIQFKDLLYSLSSSVATGRHLREALAEAGEELGDIYKKSDVIMVEINQMINSMTNTNAKDTDVLDSLAQRSGLDDIHDFAEIYKSCKTTGGNLIVAINKSAAIIGEKISIEAEIKSMSAQKRLEGNIITVMPVIITLFLKTVSPDYLAILYATLAGRLIMAFSLACTVAAYFAMERITKIEV